MAAIIVTGCSVRSSCAARDLVERVSDFPLYFTAGVHPHNAKDCQEDTLVALRELASHPRCVAIGECGLDFNRNFSPPDVQEQWFDAQVGLAVELGKPLFMHCRDAGQRVADILGRHVLPAPSVIHCFTGTAEELQEFLRLGMCIGITGWVCDDRPERGGAELAALLPSIPADRLLIETDAPYLVPRTIKPNKSRPHRNEPALLPHVLNTVAASLGKPMDEVARQTTRNACRVFGISVPGLS